ncbi:MAG TPA: hypothetical protein VGG45_14865 [Terracidiphilus sp.]|jgi:hypothetical protein
MAHRFGILRRFRFNLPQRIAAALLAAFLLQGFWVVSRQTLTDTDYQYARCGRETWEKPSPLAGYYTSCGNIHDGILAYRLAGLPLTLDLLLERGVDLFRNPENRVALQPGAELSTWELRHQMTHILLLMRLPFLFAGFVLGGCIWWVTRRLFGNLGGYTALALYCFSPGILKACVAPNPDVLAALGVFGGVYTCIGVAHAMQGPQRKWRPRVVLLMVILGVAAAAHIAALPVAAILGLLAMLWIAEGHRSQVLPVVLVAVGGALLLLFACYSFSPDAFSYVFRSSSGFLWLSTDPARRFFSTLSNDGETLAMCASIVLYLTARKSRYFGNTLPLLCGAFLMLLIMTGAPGAPWLWSLPFLLTFIGGVFADAYEGPRGKLALGAGGAIVLAQAVLCILSLPLLSQ